MRTIRADRICKILYNEFTDCGLCLDCIKRVKERYKRFFVSTRNHNTIALVSTRGKNLDDKRRYMLCIHDAKDIERSGEVAVNPYKKYKGDVIRFKIVSTDEEEDLGDLNL